MCPRAKKGWEGGQGGKLTRSERRVEHVDVNANVHQGVTDARLDPRYQPVGAEPVEVPGRDQREAAARVIPQVAPPPDQGPADAGVQGGVLDEALASCE